MKDDSKCWVGSEFVNFVVEFKGGVNISSVDSFVFVTILNFKKAAFMQFHIIRRQQSLHLYHQFGDDE